MLMAVILRRLLVLERDGTLGIQGYVRRRACPSKELASLKLLSPICEFFFLILVLDF